MKSNAKRYIICCILLSVTIFLAFSGFIKLSAHELPPNVLILNSYHKGLSWTDHENEGITHILQSYKESCNIFIEYMDWKNYPTEENVSRFYDYLKYKYAHKTFDVILVTDDAATEFVFKHREDLFFDTPVVFCGINQQGADQLLKGQTRFTGVMEIIDPENTLKAALEINPELKEVYVLYDNTESGLSTGELTLQAIKEIKPDILRHTFNNRSLEEILNEVEKAPQDSIILITTYYKDHDGRSVGFENFSSMVSQRSTVPVFHLYDFGLNHGALGGSMLSGRLQGEEAGKQAVKVLKGEAISDISIETKKTTRLVFDYQQLERFGIGLRELPDNSEIINRPYSFIKEHINLVITVALLILLMLIFIIILMFYINRIRKMSKELQQNHEELKESDHRLRKQYEELQQMQENLSSSESRYSLLFERMLNGFFVFEPVLNAEGKLVDVRFIDVNPGFKQQIGIDTEDIIGRTWTEVYKYPNHNLHIYHKILHTGNAIKFETYYPNTEIYYLVNAFKIAENKIGVVFDNITVYKYAIKEIKTLNEELEKRVKDRTNELQSVVKELEAFTYTVSHDLKSPLRAVEGYSRIVLEDFGAKLGEEGAEIINNISCISKDMIEMINKLLNYSTTSKKEITKEEINIEEIYLSIFTELKSVNSDRQMKLIVETGLPRVFADRILLRQAIYNILSNSVKFTRYKEKAVIKVGCTITGDEYVFYVRDNGAGFDMEYAEKLFGIFQRLHSNDEFEGSGIGLVTVKKIIQKHGGRVWIEGKADEGACIYFTLPNSRQL